MDRSSQQHSRHRLKAVDSRDSLEDEQQRNAQYQKRPSGGDEEGLTEVAVPDPVNRRHSRRDSLEGEEGNAGRRISEEHLDEDRDTALTEVAAPQPVETLSDEGEDTTPQSVDEEKAEDTASPSGRRSHLTTELYTVSWLIFFSFLGTLARLGLEAITQYPNAPISTVVLWANLGGSLFLGFLSEDRRIFREEYGKSQSDDYSFRRSSDAGSITPSMRERAGKAHGKVKKTIPLYIGLATGFCGSFTSFSSFIRDAFLALTNDLSPSPSGYPLPTQPIHSRNGGYSFMALLAILILHPTISLGALNFGAHLALACDPILYPLPFRLVRRLLDPLAVLLAFGCWLGAILLTIWPPNHTLDWRPRATFSLIFAPPGCLLRFYASKYLNSRTPSFPLGTFAVNIFGTAVLGMCFDLQHAGGIGAGPGGSYTSCAALEGVMEGFCGCTTTVSTWVAELNGLRRRHAYVYGLSSVAVGLGCLVCIMGGMGWSGGFSAPVCG